MMALWYPTVNATGTLAGAFGSLNQAVSGNVLINGDWFWTIIGMAIFFVLILVFQRNGNEMLESAFASSLIMLVLAAILYSIGIIFIIMPMIFFLLVLVTMSLSIANKPSY